MKRLFWLILLLASPAFATTFYTSSTGTDTANDCTNISNPCNLSNGLSYELGRAQTAHSDVINMCAGACDGSGSVTLTSSSLRATITGPSGTSYSNALTIQPYCSGVACETLTIQPPSGLNGCLWLFDALSYMIVGNPSDPGRHLIFDAINGDNTLESPTATDVICLSGNDVPPVNHLRLINLELKNMGRDGVIDGEGTHHNEYINLSIHGGGLSNHGHGVYICGNDSLVQGGEIYSFVNTVERSIGVQLFCDSVTDPAGTADNNVIDGVYIHDMPGGGLTLGGPGGKGTNNILKNSLLVGNHNHQVGLCGTGAKAYNNTIVKSSTADGILVCGPDTTYESKQNIIYGNTNGDYLVAGGSVTKANNVENGVVPKFTDYAGGDYSLAADSPALDVAACLTGITLDFSGQIRPQGPLCDAGYLERPGSNGVTSPNTRFTQYTDTFGSAAGQIGSPWTQLAAATLKARYDGSGNAVTTASDSRGASIRQTTATYSTTQMYTEIVYQAGSATDGTDSGSAACLDSSGNGYINAVYNLSGQWKSTTARLDAWTGGADLGTVNISAPVAGTTRIGMECNFTTHQFWAMIDDAVISNPTDSTYSSGMKPALIVNGNFKIASVDTGDLNTGGVGGVLTVTGPTTGSVCVSGQSCLISWTHANLTGAIDCGYLVGGNYYSVATPAVTDNSYSWTVNAPASSSSQVRCKQGAVTSDGSAFTIRGTKSQFR